MMDIDKIIGGFMFVVSVIGSTAAIAALVISYLLARPGYKDDERIAEKAKRLGIA